MKTKDKIIANLLIGVLTLIALLPFRALYVISDFLYLIVRYVLKYRRRVIDLNLKRSFPEKSDAEREDIRNAYYRHMCDLIVETIKLLHVSNETMRKHVLIANPEVVEKLAEDGRSFIMFMSHYGNFEYAREMCYYYKRPKETGEIYRPAKSPVGNAVIMKMRNHYPTIKITQKQTIRTLMSFPKEGRQVNVAFLSDQRPNDVNLNHWTTFLGQDTAYPAGGEAVGVRINAHFIYLDVQKPRRGYYVMSYREIVPDANDKEPNPYTRMYMKMLEETIRRDPRYWLWSHKRWLFDRNGNVNE